MKVRPRHLFLPLICFYAISGPMQTQLPAQTITSVVNAASSLSGGVAPGEIVVINGASLGPAALAAAPVTGATSLPISLSGVSVSFNGIPAPIVYVSASQTSVQVPYELAGSGSAAVVVTNGSGQSPAFSTPVVLSAPGLFTANYSGTGQAVAMDFGGPNSTRNPVAPGSSIVLYATGEGVTSPAGVDGQIQTLTTIHIPMQPISVQIGGISAQVLFAGSVPGDIPGVVQIGVLVPPTLSASNAAPVVLTIGGVTATPLTTLVVQP